MSGFFRELLEQLAAEHDRLERECGALRAEADACRAGQVARGSGDVEPLSPERRLSSRGSSSVSSSPGREAVGMRERRVWMAGCDLDAPPELTFLEPEQEERRDAGARSGSKDSYASSLGGEGACEAGAPARRACVVIDPTETVAGGRGHVSFLDLPPSLCKGTDSRTASTFSKKFRRSRTLPGGSSTQLCAPSAEPRLWPIWAIEEDSPAHTTSRPNLGSKTLGNLSFKEKKHFEEALRSESGGCAQRMVMEPESRCRVGWDMIRLATLSYDVLMMPMLAFLGDDDEPEEKQVADLVTTFIWTIDMPITFFSGYHHEGVLEMRPGKIWRRYLQTWFLLDFPLIAIDWLATLLLHGSVGDVFNVARMSKLLRFCRALRLFRVLRVLKFPRWADSVHHYLRSEASATAFSIMRSLAFIVVASHFVACGWYFMGGRERPSTWLQALDDEDRDLAYRYTTAMHWAVTQFTPASMEVVPKNTPERVFAIVIILAAVVGFSCFLSSITQAMANLQRASMENSKQRSMLRRYITQNRISLDLGNKIMRFLRSHRLMDKRRVHEDDVQVLKLLPEALRSDLHREVYAPVVEHHPFFERAYKLEEGFSRELCHVAAAEVSLGRLEELFRPGHEAAYMYFMREGLWEYRRPAGRGRDARPVGVRGGGERWVMEAALWLQWEVRGSLVAESPAEAVSLAAAKFQSLVARLPALLAPARQYANEFWQGLEEQDSRDEGAVELGPMTEDLRRMAQACFNLDVQVSRSSRSLPLAATTPKGTTRRFFESDGGRTILSPKTQKALKCMRSMSF